VETFNGNRVDGVYYPRAAVLGGCTAVNAMTFLYPHNADWDYVASLTGDDSWNAVHMRKYFERLENCRYRPLHRLLSKLGLNLTRHGWKGWLSTEVALPKSRPGDANVVQAVMRAVQSVMGAGPPHLSQRQIDPNDWRLVRRDPVSVCYLPLTTRDHARIGTQELLRDVARQHPNQLKIELNALATRVLLDEANRAVGVEYLKGERLYRAHAVPSQHAGELRQCFVSREVILASGAFNTPQLLMLSGIGSADQLHGHGIGVRVNLPGVGRNLQDQYEVSVVNQMTFDKWKELCDLDFSRQDAAYQQWKATRGSIYASNGSLLTVLVRSDAHRPVPDLLCTAMLGRFAGYWPGYAGSIFPEADRLTWTILKAHSNHSAGSVRLRSADPRDPPQITFFQFEEGNDTSGTDLEAMVAGIKLVRRITSGIKDSIAKEELPGEHVHSDDQLREFIRNTAWSSQASCTCPIGAVAAVGVLNSNFEVHGTKGLRVVDASAFPRIPGFYIVSAVYMIAEKASDVILTARRRSSLD
jgi:choline dehydrogenase-like flavoprotein